MKKRNGFSLLELLVSISVIATLSAMLLPAVSRTKMRARTALCLGNQRTLSQAFALYSTDNQAHLPINAEVPFPDVAFTNWVAGHMGGADLKAEAALMQNPSRSLFHPYVPRNEPYACAIRNLAKPRTLALSSRMNPTPVVLTNMWQWTPGHSPAFRTISDIQNPARTFTFIEESPSSIGDAYFAVDHSGTGQPYAKEAGEGFFFADAPGLMHDGATVVSFADGHEELHHWQSPEMRAGHASQRSRPAGGQADVAWLRAVSLGAP